MALGLLWWSAILCEHPQAGGSLCRIESNYKTRCLGMASGANLIEGKRGAPNAAAMYRVQRIWMGRPSSPSELAANGPQPPLKQACLLDHFATYLPRHELQRCWKCKRRGKLAAVRVVVQAANGDAEHKILSEFAPGVHKHFSS